MVACSPHKPQTSRVDRYNKPRYTEKNESFFFKLLKLKSICITNAKTSKIRIKARFFNLHKLVFALHAFCCVHISYLKVTENTIENILTTRRFAI